MKLDVSYIKLTLTEVRYNHMKKLLAFRCLLVLLFVHLLETVFMHNLHLLHLYPTMAHVKAILYCITV